MSLQLRPNSSLPLEQAVAKIEQEIINEIRDIAGDAGVTVS